MKTEKNAGTPSRSSFRTIARDIHFWIPLLVLSAGLFVLHMLH
jgi:hypothetical protein